MIINNYTNSIKDFSKIKSYFLTNKIYNNYLKIKIKRF